MYTTEEKEMMMKTARASGAVGANAVLPRVLRTMIDGGFKVLDFGSGPNAVQTMALRDEGFNVLAHDINPVKTTWHIEPHVSYHYYFDAVFASNVLNVQPDAQCIEDVVREVWHYVGRYSFALFNYPASPRKSGLTTAEIDAKLKEQFMDVERIRQIDDWKISTPVWKCKKGG